MADGTRRTTFRSLLTELRQYLITRTGLAPERVFVRMRTPRFQTNIPAQQFVILRPGNAQVDRQWHDSEGRLAIATERVLLVEPYLQLSMDTVRSDDRLADAFLQWEDQLIDLLDIYEPLNALEPIHFMGIEMEKSDMEVPPEEATPKWASSKMSFSVKFLQLVDQSRQ